MSPLNGKSVKAATLHQPIHHEDIGQIGPALRSVQTNQNKPVKMTIMEPWVLLEVPNAKDKKKIVKVPVPISGFTHIVLDDEKNS